MSCSRLDAIVGPAGTGKTTTLGAVKAAWEVAYGVGSVVGLAPAAASAEVLGSELRMVTENVAKWLHESVGSGAAERAARFFQADDRLRGASVPHGPIVRRLQQEVARLAAEQAQWRFQPNQLVIVDEASMVSTFQLAALVGQAKVSGAKILLVGDPAQLDSIDAGGVLGWLDRQGIRHGCPTEHDIRICADRLQESGRSRVSHSGELLDKVDRRGNQRHRGCSPDQRSNQSARLLTDQSGEELKDHHNHQRSHHHDDPPVG
nr:AAA family ATPase [Arthrobacter sp. M2012083]